MSVPVLEAALADSLYAHHLFSAATHPQFLEVLLRTPPATSAVATFREMPMRQQMLQAIDALGRWAKMGFRLADESTVARRLTACAACPHRRGGPTPNSLAELVRRLGLASGADTCGVCGCLLNSKARLSSEQCPEADPQHPSLTRWGEPVTLMVAE